MERWANGLPGSIEASQGSDLVVWSFRTTHFLSGNIEQLARDLDVKMHKEFDSRLPDDSLDHTVHQNPRLVFVTHGVGAWVLKELFASNLSINYRPYVCGVVYVDALQLSEEDYTSTKLDGRYEAYLEDLTQTLGFKSTKKDDHARAGIQRLASQMRSVDQKSTKVLEGLPLLREVGPEGISRHRPLLLSQSPEAGSIQSSCLFFESYLVEKS